MNWICSQIGAREHFAIPRALQQEDRLDKAFTDLKRSGLEQVSSRFVKTFPLGGLKWWWILRNSANHYADFIEHGRWFSEAVLSSLKSTNVEGKIFFGYDTGFLEAATELKKRGASCIVGQIDPGRVEFDLVQEERKIWPGWEPHAGAVPEAYHQRRDAEWKVADLIIVNSEWSREALITQGVEAEKIKIVPLSFEPPSTALQKTESPQSEKFQVLWLGQVNLRKGIQYLLEAAEKLKNEPVKFTIVGPINISKTKVAKAPTNVEFVGPVKRSSATHFYQQADAFVLPTLSDGFALTQLEAMAHGLSAISTPNCGRVVENQQNGLVVPPRDSDALANAIMTLAEDRETCRAMGASARETSGRFGLNQLATDLLSIKL